MANFKLSLDAALSKKNIIEKQQKNYYIYNITNQIEKASDAIEAMNKQSSLASVGMESLSASIGGSLIPALANLALTAASEFLYNITHSAEIAQQKMEETAQTVSDFQENIRSLNENLDSTTDRINSLMAQDSLSLIDQQELQLLQQQNSELERQIEIKQRLSAFQEKQLAQDTMSAFEKNYGNTNLNISENAIKDYKDSFGTNNLSFLYDLSDINDINATIAALDILKEKQENLTDNDSEGYARSIQNNIDTLTEDLWSDLSNLEQYRSTLSSVSGDLLTVDQTNTLTLLDSIISQSMEYIDPTYNIGQKLNGIFAKSNFAYLKENLLSAAKSGDAQLEDMINNTAGLKEALASVNLTTDDLKRHITELSNASNQSLSGLKSSLKEAFQPPSGAGWSNSTFTSDNPEDEFNSWLDTLDDSQLKLLYEVSLNTDTAKLSLADWQSMLKKAEAQSISFESVSEVLNDAAADMDNLNAAMASSYSGKGINAQQIKSIMEMFKDMDGYDPSRLFEKSASGVRLNTDELHRLQKQYEALKSQQFAQDLAKKQQELNSMISQGINNDYTDKLSEEIVQIQLLQNQYEGLTSAYNKWLSAQSAGEKGDTYDSIAGTMLQRGKELYEQGLIGTNEFAAITQFMSSEDLTNATAQTLQQVFAQQSSNMEKFFTQDRTGVDNFLQEVVQHNLGQWHIKTDEFGNEKARSFEFVSDAGMKLEEIYGFSDEFFDYIAQKARDLGIENNYDNENSRRKTSRSYDYQENSDWQSYDAQEEVNRRRKRAANAYNLGTDTSQSFEEYLDYVEQLKEIPEEVRTQAYLDINQPENAFLDLDAMYADYQTALSTLNNTNSTEQAKQSALSTIHTIAGILADTPGVNFPVDFDLTNLTPEEIQQALLNGGTAQIPAEVTPDTTQGSSEVNNFLNQVGASETKVKIGANLAPAITAVAGWIPGSKFVNIYARYVDDTSGGTRNGYGTLGGGQVNGTAHALASGSLHLDYLRSHHPFIYGAYAGGNWGLPYNQTALVGELAPEMLVRDGRWQLIGQRGAQFMGLKRGDIVFNHRQTRQLLENGWVTGRGRTIGFNSHVMGTVNSANAFAEGTAAQFRNSDYGDTPIISTVKQIKEASEDFCEAMDYISIALDRMTKSIEHNKSLADLFQTYRDQNPELDKAAAQLTEKQKFSQRAYDRYMAQADASGLSQEYKSQIQSGSLDITNVTDETLKAQIDEYQKWYEKAQDVRDEIIDIGRELRDINLQKLENITDDFDKVISYKNSLLDVMETINELNNLKGIATTESDLTEQMNAQADISGYYAGEVEQLTAEFEALVSSGVIVEFSDDWYEWNETIQKTKNSLLDSNKALLELKSDIMELRLKPFEDAIDQIEALEDQLSDMDDLINDNAIFSENGTLTNAGITRIGLMGQQLAASKQKAAEYANAIAALKTNLNNGNISQEEYNELLKDYTAGQSKAVSATKKAMDAIIDLVKDGINKEADAYGKLIDAKKKDLQATREYEDYVDELDEKQSKINAKEAQIAAMEGDETKAQQLRKLKKELAQLQKEYVKTVDDHSFDAAIQGYDDAKQAFEDNAENARNEMDNNFDAQQQAILQTLNIAKDNYSEVYAYIGTLADVYGAALTEDVVHPWTSAKAAVESYKAAVEQATAKTAINTDTVNVAPKPPTNTTPSDEKESSSIIAPIVNPPHPAPAPEENRPNSNNIFNGIPESPGTKGAGWLARNTSINDRLYWNGYMGGYGNQQILYNNLNGASVHGGYAGSMAQNMWLLEQLKSRGFRRGGIVDVDPAFALRASGESVLAMARPGEYILTRQQTGLLSAFMDKLPALDKLMSAPALLSTTMSDSSAPVTINVGSMIGTVGTLEKQALPELEVILNRACDKFENRLRQEFKRPQFGGIRR